MLSHSHSHSQLTERRMRLLEIKNTMNQLYIVYFHSQGNKIIHFKMVKWRIKKHISNKKKTQNQLSVIISITEQQRRKPYCHVKWGVLLNYVTNFINVKNIYIHSLQSKEHVMNSCISNVCF